MRWLSPSGVAEWRPLWIEYRIVIAQSSRIAVPSPVIPQLCPSNSVRYCYRCPCDRAVVVCMRLGLLRRAQRESFWPGCWRLIAPTKKFPNLHDQSGYGQCASSLHYLRPFRSSKSSIIRPLWIDQRPTPDWHSAQTGTNQSTAASPLSPFCWTPNRAGSKCKGTEHSAVASCEVGNYYGSGKLLLATQRNPGHASRPDQSQPPEKSPKLRCRTSGPLQAPSAPLLLLNPIPKPNLHQLLLLLFDRLANRLDSTRHDTTPPQVRQFACSIASPLLRVLLPFSSSTRLAFHDITHLPFHHPGNRIIRTLSTILPLVNHPQTQKQWLASRSTPTAMLVLIVSPPRLSASC